VNSHGSTERATGSVYDASPTKRLVVRQELLDGQPTVLWVVEYDYELGAPECSADELLTAVGQVVARADALPNIVCRVFTSVLLDGRRNFVEWSPTDDGRLLGRREPDELPPALLTAELLNESLAQYGAHQQLGEVC
jgi:hypothetical protein